MRVWPWVRSAATFLERASRPANWLTRTVTVVIGVVAVAQGVQVWIGGRTRWGSPTYAVLRKIPYTPQSMAAAIFVFGVVVLFGFLAGWWVMKMIGLILVAAWSMTFAIGVLVAMRDPHAGSTALWSYIGISLVVTLMGFVRDPPIPVHRLLAALRRHAPDAGGVDSAPVVGPGPDRPGP